MIKAEIVAHSLSPQGDELISVLCTFPRIILAEVNTHRMLSKNTSSSRAIPFEKMVEAVHNNPFIPIAWQKDHKGMQGNEYVTDKKHIDNCIAYWLECRDWAINGAKGLNDNKLEGVTKQLCNRILEPFMWTTMLITGSRQGWDNFFNLRCPQYDLTYGGVIPEDMFKSKKDVLKGVGDDLVSYEWANNKSLLEFNNLDWLKLNKGQAEIHMMALAEAIYDSVNESTPEQLQKGEWHIPFAKQITEMFVQKEVVTYKELHTSTYIKISTAMAAHTSYTIVGGEAVKSYEKWIELHDKLIAYDPPHSSPMEHCARAMSDEEYSSFIKGNLDSEINEDGFIDISTHINNHSCFGWCYNLKGFIPYRYMIDNKTNIE